MGVGVGALVVVTGAFVFCVPPFVAVGVLVTCVPPFVSGAAVGVGVTFDVGALVVPVPSGVAVTVGSLTDSCIGCCECYSSRCPNYLDSAVG